VINKNNTKFYLDKKFLEWLAGFTDSEGNFSISLRKENKSNNINESYKSLLLTFQIGLHIDDLKICNYFVNDKHSLSNIILPIFNNTQLNSTKYSQFQTFQKAVNLFEYKKHLTNEGKLNIIEIKNQLNTNVYLPENILITDN
jgi:hypothetical protein